MAYSAPEDLLVGDLAWSPRVPPSKFVDGAAEEIDVKLAVLYKVPLEKNGEPLESDSWEFRLLKQINNKIASGRAIMAFAVSQEDTAVHAYGNHLLKEGLAELMLIANGELVLDVTRADGAEPPTDRSRLPETINHDEESLLLGFEETVLRGNLWFSRPGAVN